MNRSALLSTALFLCAVVFSAFLAGCGQEKAMPQYFGPIKIAPIDAGGLDAAIARHRGKAVLVDFWATWCPPCIALFPHTVELSRRFPAADFAVITVSLDDPDSLPAVQKFLNRHNADTENYFSMMSGQAAVEAFEIDDGGIPHLRVYDRQGNLVGKILGAYPEKIDDLVMLAMERK